MAILPWKFVNFHRYHKIHYGHIDAQHFVLPILLELPKADCTFATVNSHKLAGMHFLPLLFRQAGREASCSAREELIDYTARTLRQQKILLSPKRLGKQSFKDFFFHIMHKVRDMLKCTTLPALKLFKVHRAEHIKKQSKVTRKAIHFKNKLGIPKL